MQHENYIQEQIEADPRFNTRLAVAQACLSFSEAVEWERSQRRIPVDQLAHETDLASDRIVAIEEGETPSLEEVLLLSSALGIDVVIDHRTGMKVSAATRAETTLNQHSL